MSTGPTPITPGCAGTPLSHLATESHNRATNSPTHMGDKASDSISDTLETTDREPDGRQIPARQDSQEDNKQNDHGSLLDLSG